ncbi:translation initiation factor IF-3 [Anopheles bellator]|uniref:translation initiation factor IF-3 n=1 Tax=Anopheles bellator TaxID=139047 RepID=UPI002647AC07|nr:translation initiation factor IF-3 [Anopheles bellator]
MIFITRIIANPSIRQVAFSRVRCCLPAVSVPTVANYSAKTTKPDSGSESRGATGARSERKAKISPKVTLIGSDESISVVNLEEATKISNRRNLKLVKVSDLDTKTQRPVYRLMTGSEYLTEDLKRREEKKKSKQDATVKGDKVLTISARIAEHDLVSKMQNVQRWLNKSFEVRVVVTADGAANKAKLEDIVSRFETSVKECGKIVQKRLRDNDMRFNILPSGGGLKKTLLDASKESTTGDAQSTNRGIHTRAGLMA